MKPEEENKIVDNPVDKVEKVEETQPVAILDPEKVADGLAPEIQGETSSGGATNYFLNEEILAKRIKEYFEDYVCIDEFGNVIRRVEEEDREIPQKDGTVKVQTVKRVVTTLRYPPTLSSLALYLGIDRNTLTNYGKSQEFYSTIKRAKDRVHSFNENTLYNKSSNTVGVIFVLKNNFGWRDRIENIDPLLPDKKETDMDKTKTFLENWLTPSQPVEKQGTDNAETEAPVSTGVVEEVKEPKPEKKGMTLEEMEAQSFKPIIGMN